MNERILEMKWKGYCCSQIVMALGLERIGRPENEDLIAAMRGLCDGLWSGKTCGTLSAAVCFLCLAKPGEAGMGLVRDLTDWFEAAFGTTECAELLEGKEINKAQKCPMLVENTMRMLAELLEE